MQFDKQSHKELALQAINNVNVPGKLIDEVYEYKQAILNATVGGEAGQETAKAETTPRKLALRDVEATPKTAIEEPTPLASEPTTEAAATTETTTAPKRSWPARKPRGAA